VQLVQGVQVVQLATQARVEGEAEAEGEQVGPLWGMPGKVQVTVLIHLVQVYRGKKVQRALQHLLAVQGVLEATVPGLRDPLEVVAQGVLGILAVPVLQQLRFVIPLQEGMQGTPETPEILEMVVAQATEGAQVILVALEPLTIKARVLLNLAAPETPDPLGTHQIQVLMLLEAQEVGEATMSVIQVTEDQEDLAVVELTVLKDLQETQVPQGTQEPLLHITL
jgi:hypothetical protein